MRIFISPHVSQIRDDNGVGRIVHAQYKHLPSFGIELVGDAASADIVACHITADGLPRVDVLHCHGLYWTADAGGNYQKWHHEANSKIIEAARSAEAVTVPSNWVAEPFKRDMRLGPAVIGHGIDLHEWQPVLEHKSYILWNKNRNGDVCDPTPAWELALRGATVVSTFTPLGKQPPATMHITGPMEHAKMREVVRHAEVYLATTQETFGVGTLEAMAAGVPVLGYRHGGTADLVEHGVTGWLVEPGDIEGLIEGLEWLKTNRAEVGAAARESARAYDWQNVIGQYATLYQEVMTNRESAPRGVSVVISCHNYGRYVGDAIRSLANQTQTPDEVVIVDDGSTDDSLDKINEALEAHPIQGARVQVISQANQGVAAARNNAIATTTQPYIVSLDADDALAPQYVETLHKAMLADRGLGVAYTGLMIVNPDGSDFGKSQWPIPFDWEVQTKVSNPPSNCIPSASMFRRDMWERAGGYKQVYAPAEDTEFYTRGLSIGFRAKQVTDEPLFRYRAHPLGAHITKKYKPIDTWHPWMRDKQHPMGVPAKVPPLVRSYSSPSVSVIVPVGPNHQKYLPACLDSLLGQSCRAWEVIVINDSGEPLQSDLQRVYPFARFIDTKGKQGPSAARNLGINNAKAPLLLFLDADDYLMPEALTRMLSAHLESRGKYVYTDWFAVRGNEVEPHQSPEYSQVAWLQRGQHAVTALIPTEWAKQVGGFDESIRGWEDWDFFIKLAINGYCGHRLAEPLLAYRQHTGTMREMSLARKDELLQWLKARYGDYATGDKHIMACCGGSGTTQTSAQRGLQQQRGMRSFTGEVTVVEASVERLRYIGQNVGAITFKIQGTNRRYRGGDNATDRYIDAHPDDVEYLISTGKWERELPFVEAPAPSLPFPNERLQSAAIAPTVETVEQPTQFEQVDQGNDFFVAEAGRQDFSPDEELDVPEPGSARKPRRGRK